MIYLFLVRGLLIYDMCVRLNESAQARHEVDVRILVRTWLRCMFASRQSFWRPAIMSMYVVLLRPSECPSAALSLVPGLW